jgi:hypothetical protein
MNEAANVQALKQPDIDLAVSNNKDMQRLLDIRERVLVIRNEPQTLFPRSHKKEIFALKCEALRMANKYICFLNRGHELRLDGHSYWIENLIERISAAVAQETLGYSKERASHQQIKAFLIQEDIESKSFSELLDKCRETFA